MLVMPLYLELLQRHHLHMHLQRHHPRARPAAAAAAHKDRAGKFDLEFIKLVAIELAIHYVRQLSSIYSRYYVTVEEANLAVKIGADYLALRALNGWKIGANDIQICLIMTYYLLTCPFM